MCSPDELSELIDFSSGCDDTPMVGTPILNNSANHCFKGLLNSISITGSDYPVSRRGVQGLNLNNPDYFVSTQRLKELFRIFCKSRGLKPLDENILGKELLQFGISKDRIMKNNERDYYYIGIIPREQLQPRNNTLITV